MKRIYVLTLLMLAVVLPSFAQNKCNIKKAYAFYTVSMPGAQMVDENGNPIPPKPDIMRFIYIEALGTGKPAIEAVLYNNKPLSVTLVAVKGRSVIAGSEFSKNNKFKIVASKYNTLWKIELQPQEGNAMPDQDCKNIIIKTRVKGKTCTLKLVKETELETMPRY